MKAAATKKQPKKIIDIEPRWLRIKAAEKYYSMGYKKIEKIANECDAKKKVDGKIVLYDIQKIDRYLTTL
jgi:hypothetical protein